MIEHLAIVRTMCILAFKRAVQYRADFFLEGAVSLFMVGIQLVPIYVLFSQRTTIAGWSYPDVLVLYGWYLIVRSVLEGVIAPSLSEAVGGIRTGQFDYLLLRPADSMFLCSISQMKPWRLVNFVAGLCFCGYGLGAMAQVPSAADFAIAALMSLMGLATVYSLFVLSVAGSFVLVRVQNLMNVLSALIDFSRWPVQVFEGVWRLVFTFVLPLAVITTFPAMALRGALTPAHALTSIAVATAFFVLARLVWRFAVNKYRSASS